MPIAVASTTVRIVAASSNDCTTSFADVPLSPASSSDAFLVAAFAQGNGGPQATAFVDELTTTGATNTRLRLIAAAFTGAGSGGNTTAPVDLYVAGGVATPSIFDDVPFGGIAPGPATVDANGYLSRDAFVHADLRVRLHASLDLLDDSGFSTTAAHVYSFFTVGVHSLLPGNATPMRLLACDDTAAPVGHLGVCTTSGTEL
ncbi:MAG: hypothetical protein ACRELB_13830 [Polyangiaceae bacterium]